jgi:hypothetical protein
LTCDIPAVVVVVVPVLVFLVPVCVLVVLIIVLVVVVVIVVVLLVAVVVIGCGCGCGCCCCYCFCCCCCCCFFVVVAERLHIVELAVWRFQPIPKQKLEQIEIIILLRWTVKYHIKRRPVSYIPMFVAKVAVDVSQLNSSIYEYWVLCLGQGKTMSLEVVAFASPYVCVYICVCVSLKKNVYVCICRKTWKLQKHVYKSEYIWSSVGQPPPSSPMGMGGQSGFLWFPPSPLWPVVVGCLGCM